MSIRPFRLGRVRERSRKVRDDSILFGAIALVAIPWQFLS